MTAYFSQYEIATGLVRFNNQCPEDQLPPEGPLYEGSEFAVIHGKHCRHTGIVIDGKISRISDEEAVAIDRDHMWFQVRRLKKHWLDATQFKVGGDYPLTKEEKRKLKRQRKRTREITKATDDPREALRILNKVWSDE